MHVPGTILRHVGSETSLVFLRSEPFIDEDNVVHELIIARHLMFVVTSTWTDDLKWTLIMINGFLGWTPICWCCFEVCHVPVPTEYSGC